MATSDLLPTTLVATGATPAAISKLSAPAGAPAKDEFAKQAGPDVSFKGPDGLTEAYAVFQIDPESKKLQVMVVDAEGRILRAIPPRSVNQMIETMSRYRP
jgi:hypothetical protein